MFWNGLYGFEAFALIMVEVMKKMNIIIFLNLKDISLREEAIFLFSFNFIVFPPCINVVLLLENCDVIFIVIYIHLFSF